MIKKYIIGTAMAMFFAGTSIAEESKLSQWGDGYYYGMRISEVEFRTKKADILKNLSANFKNDKLSDGIWAFYSIRDWSLPKYESSKNELWGIVLQGRQSPELCEYALHYLPAERLEGYQEKAAKCIMNKLELVVKKGPQWPQQRFLPLVEDVADRISTNSRYDLAFWAGMYWSDAAFDNEKVRSYVKQTLEKKDMMSKHNCNHSRLTWSKKRAEFLKCK